MTCNVYAHLDHVQYCSSFPCRGTGKKLSGGYDLEVVLQSQGDKPLLLSIDSDIVLNSGYRCG